MFATGATNTPNVLIFAVRPIHLQSHLVELAVTETLTVITNQGQRSLSRISSNGGAVVSVLLWRIN